MKYVFVDESWEDYLYWQKMDKKSSKKSTRYSKTLSDPLLKELENLSL